MENERNITLTWIERHTIKYALIAETRRLHDVMNEAIRMNLGRETVDAIVKSINDNLLLIDKFRDKE